MTAQAKSVSTGLTCHSGLVGCTVLVDEHSVEAFCSRSSSAVLAVPGRRDVNGILAVVDPLDVLNGFVDDADTVIYWEGGRASG